MFGQFSVSFSETLEWPPEIENWTDTTSSDVSFLKINYDPSEDT